MKVPVVIFWNNWKTLKEFRFIDFSFDYQSEPPSSMAVSVGLLGLGVVVCWLDKKLKDEHDYYDKI